MTQLVAEIVGDASKFTKATTQATQQAQSLTDRLQDVGKGMVIGAGIGAFNLLTGAIDTAIGKLGEAHDAYLEDAASQSKLTAALQANIPAWDGRTDAIEEVIGAQMRLGFSDDEQRSSLAELSAITKDVTEAQKLQSLAMDLARFKNLDLGTASDIVGKVYAGNLGTLSRYGIVLGENATKEEALAAIQKMAAGQAEAFAAGPLGKQAAAQLKVGEAMEKVGGIVDQVSQVVMPIFADVLTGLVDTFGRVWDSIQPVIATITGGLGPVIENIGGQFSGLNERIGPVTSSFGFITDTVIPAVGAAMSWVADNILPPLIASFRMIADSVLPVLMMAFNTVVTYVRDNWPTISRIATQVGNIVKTVAEVIQAAISAVAPVVMWIAERIFPFLAESAGWLLLKIDEFFTQIGQVWQTALDVAGVVGNVIAWFGYLGDFIDSVPGRIGDALYGMFAPLWEGFRAFINQLISGWNALKFTVPSIDLGPLGTFGGFTLGTPNLPYLHTGGIVPGVPGSDVLSVLQAGELVVPRGQAAGTVVHIHIDRGAYIDGPSVDRLANLITQRLRLAGVG